MGWQDTSVPFYTEVTPRNRRFHTPSMEQLAVAGMKFTQAYACSVCTPTRVSLMTGLSAARHRVMNWTFFKDKSMDVPHPTLDAMVEAMDKSLGDLLDNLRRHGYQPCDYPASLLRYAFRVGHPIFHRLVANCLDTDVQYEFERIASGQVKSGQCVAAQRLINAVCEAPAFIAQCGTKLKLDRFLAGGGILLVQGGPV